MARKQGHQRIIIIIIIVVVCAGGEGRSPPITSRPLPCQCRNRQGHDLQHH
jgi:hypothetical protein